MPSTARRGTDDEPISTYIISFNCARTLIDVDFFAEHLLDGLGTTQDKPDVVALSLQEIAPIAYSFLSPSLLSRYLHRFQIAVKQAFEDKYGAEAADDISLVALDNVGMTAIMVFAQKDFIGRIISVQKGGTGVGLWEMGNKGAVGVRIWLRQGASEEDVALCFVAAHLAPMESAWQRRNEDWKAICQRLVFTSTDGGEPVHFLADSSSEPLLDRQKRLPDGELLLESSVLMFGGDLNYRTSDMKPHPEEHQAWPSPLQQSGSSDAFSTLLKHDQLNREREADKTLHLLDEAPINFPPTYKYSDQAQSLAASLAKERTASETALDGFWAKHRFPAWCDRILYQTGTDVKTLTYTALPIQPTSDHRPVVLSSRIKLSKAATPVSSPFTVDKHWKSRRAQARRVEILVGLAAYLTLTYEGNAILAGALVGIIGGVLTLQSLLGNR